MSQPATSCPYCRTSLKLPDKISGQVVKCKCPKCGRTFDASVPTPMVQAPQGGMDTHGNNVESNPHVAAGAPPQHQLPVPQPPTSGNASAGSWLFAGGALAVCGVLALACCVGVGALAYFLPADKKAHENEIAELRKKKNEPADEPLTETSPAGTPKKKVGDEPSFSPEADGPGQKTGLDKPVPPAKGPPKYRDGRLIVPFAAIATRERLEEVKGVQLKGSIRFTSALNVNDLTITWEGLKRLKYEEYITLGFLKILLMGNHGWMASEKRTIALEGDGLGFYQNFNYATVLSNLIALTEEGFDIQKGDDRSVRGKKCFSIVVKRAGRPTMTMFFEKGSDLLYKADFSGRFVDQNLNFSPNDTYVEFFFSEYRTTDGIKQWRKQEQWRDGKSFSEFAVTDVRFLSKSDDSIFVLPGLEAQIQVALIEEKKESLKRAAAQSPTKFGSDFSRLVKGLTDGNPAQRPLFQEALLTYADLWRNGQLAPFEAAEIPSVIVLLALGGETGLQHFAIQVVGRFGPQAASAAPALCALARKTQDAEKLAAAIEALKKTAVKIDEALSLFEKHLDHGDGRVRDAAASALLSLAPERVQLNRAMEFMARSDADIRKPAEAILRDRLASPTRKDLPVLRDGLKNPLRDVRIVFIDAIASLKTDGQDAALDLARIAGADDTGISEHAVAALKSVGKLAEVARDHADPKVLVATMGALRKEGGKSADALAILEKHSGSADAEVKNAAALAILSLAPERIKTDRLPELAKSSNEELRGAAKRLLADRSVALKSTVGKAKVEILSASVGNVPFMRRTVSGLKQMETPEAYLILKLRITNTDDFAALKYAPWHGSREQAAPPAAKDQDGKAFLPWYAGTAAWPVDGVQATRKIEPERSVTDVIAFSAPSVSAYEIDIKLPADNVGMPGQWFKLKIVRPYFEKKK